MSTDAEDYLELVAPALDAMLQNPQDRAARAQFATQAQNYFGRQSQPNALFNVLAEIDRQHTLTALASSSLTIDGGIGLALAWQASHPGRPLHLGTPYYFAGVRHILNGDLDRGFLFMHEALEADKALTGEVDPDWPAWKFVTMNAESQEQAFYEEVLAYVRFVEQRLAVYQSTNRGSLTFTELRARLLSSEPLRDVMFHLAFGVARVAKLHGHRAAFPATRFSKVLSGQLVFDLLQLTDHVLLAQASQRVNFYQLATRFINDNGLNIRQSDLDDVRRAFEDDPDSTLVRLLDGTFRTRGITPDPIAADLMITYGLRNQLAHGIPQSGATYVRFPDLEPRLFYMLFAAVERFRPSAPAASSPG